MPTITVRIANNEEEITKAKEVRRQVFQKGQGIDPMLDFDGNDETADHFIAYFDGIAAGTARVRYISNKTAKLERLSVLEIYRRSGVGSMIMDYIAGHLGKNGVEILTLDSQEHAKKFYEKIGFIQEGEIFEEAGIPHVKMNKKL